MPDIQTRLAMRQDLPEVLGMIRALAAHHSDVPQISLAALERDTLGPTRWITLLVATRRGALCGYAALTPLAQLQFGVRGMDMHHLFVTSPHRGHGVGRQLIEACKAKAKSAQCAYLTVGTHPDNHPAQQVYLKAGFQARPVAGPRFSIRL